jgi:hypothetical protein
MGSKGNDQTGIKPRGFKIKNDESLWNCGKIYT